MATDDDGMRIVRGNGQRPKVARVPLTLAEAAPGSVVLVAVRVGAHLAGPAKGPYSDALVRLYDMDSLAELYSSGDLVVRQTQRVPVYTVQE